MTKTRMMYVVTSYDFGGSSVVTLHVVTSNLELAQEVYRTVVAACPPPSDGAHMLVELTSVPTDTRLTRQLYWGEDAKLSLNNNH